MKTCTKCKEQKPLKDFHLNKSGKDGRRSECRVCTATRHKKWWRDNAEILIPKNRAYRNDPIRHEKILEKQQLYRETHREETLLAHAYKNAKRLALPYNLVVGDITIPGICPLLGIKLTYNGRMNNRDTSPSIDRIDSQFGYVKGNVWVISYRANRIKNNATLEELGMIYTSLRRKLSRALKKL